MDWFLRVEKTPYDISYAEQMRKSYEIYLEEYKIWKENVADLYKERLDNHNDDDLDDYNFHNFIHDDDTPLEFISYDTMWWLDLNEYHKKNPWYEPLLTNAFDFYSKKYLN